MSSFDRDFVKLQSSITRAANTTAYATGDLLLGASNATFSFGDTEVPGTINPKSPFYRADGRKSKGIQIHSAMITSTNVAANTMQGDLYFFAYDNVVGADNAAFAPSAGFMNTRFLGHLAMATSQWRQHTSGATWFRNNLNLVLSPNVFDLTAAWEGDPTRTDKLFAFLVAGAAYTPISAEVLALGLVIERL